MASIIPNFKEGKIISYKFKACVAASCLKWHSVSACTSFTFAVLSGKVDVSDLIMAALKLQ